MLVLTRVEEIDARSKLLAVLNESEHKFENLIFILLGNNCKIDKLTFYMYFGRDTKNLLVIIEKMGLKKQILNSIRESLGVKSGVNEAATLVISADRSSRKFKLVFSSDSCNDNEIMEALWAICGSNPSFSSIYKKMKEPIEIVKNLDEFYVIVSKWLKIIIDSLK